MDYSAAPIPGGSGDAEGQYRTMQRALERQHRLYDRMAVELKATQRCVHGWALYAW